MVMNTAMNSKVIMLARICEPHCGFLCRSYCRAHIPVCAFCTQSLPRPQPERRNSGRYVGRLCGAEPTAFCTDQVKLSLWCLLPHLR